MRTFASLGRTGALASVLLATLAASPAVHAQNDVAEREKLAQTAMKFLAVPADPRAAALGDAMTSVVNGAHSLFSNPAGMAFQNGASDLTLGNTRWIADIDYNHGSFAYQPSRSFGVIGVSLTSVDYGELQETVFDAGSEQGYRDIGTFSPQAWALGVGYARQFSDRFSAGGQVKYVSQDLGSAIASIGEGGFEAGEITREDLAQSVLAYDFGVFYRTGFESLNFAVSARNFSQEVSYAEESAELPLSLRIGLSMDVLDLTPMASGPHSLLLAVDAENPRDFAEQVKIGAEYTFAETLSLRAGYVAPSDELGFSLGAGVRQSVGGLGIGADYAYTDFGVFDAVHRVAVNLSF
ncbi:MAG: PorV/PorQ family protein [Bacteroidota bacterium]